MHICILIPHLHIGTSSEWLLGLALGSIEKQEPGLLKHTLILDDASTHEGATDCLDKMARKYGVTIVRKRKNTSYSANINVGLNLARKYGYDFAITMNNDVEMKTPFSSRLIELFNRCETLGIIGCLLHFPTGKVQHAGFTVDRHKNIEGHGRGSFHPSIGAGFVSGVTGAFQAIRLSLCSNYPTQYPLSYEDVDFCLRHWEKGIGVWYEPAICGIHFESATRGYALGQKEKESLMVYGNAVFDFDQISKNMLRFTSLFHTHLLNSSERGIEAKTHSS